VNWFDLDLTAFPYEEKINYEFWLIGSGAIVGGVESNNHLT
jgi:hypothetical protein